MSLVRCGSLGVHVAAASSTRGAASARNVCPVCMYANSRVCVRRRRRRRRREGVLAAAACTHPPTHPPARALSLVLPPLASRPLSLAHHQLLEGPAAVPGSQRQPLQVHAWPRPSRLNISGPEQTLHRQISVRTAAKKDAAAAAPASGGSICPASRSFSKHLPAARSTRHRPQPRSAPPPPQPIAGFDSSQSTQPRHHDD
jgi:hypothetical protein